MSTIMLEDEIREKLEEQIIAHLDDLGNMAPGSEEQKLAVEAVNKLYRLGIDEALAEVEYNERISTREDATELKKKELELRERELEMNLKDKASEERRDIAKIAVNAVISIGTAALSAKMIRDGFKFEETGVIRSTSMRNLFSSVFKGFKKS